MANFTPGPWVAIRIAPFSYQILADHIVVEEVRCKGNALLIAAAPELFAALEALLDISDLASDAPTSEIHRRATAALLKATGAATP